MPTAAESLIARLQADCTAAEAVERSVRASVDAQIRAAEQARAFAWRRLNALSDMARVAAREPDREAAIEGQLVALFREIGWIENGLAELGEGAQPLIDQRRPGGQALHGQAHSAAASEGDGSVRRLLRRPQPRRRSAAGHARQEQAQGSRGGSAGRSAGLEPRPLLRLRGPPYAGRRSLELGRPGTSGVSIHQNRRLGRARVTLARVKVPNRHGQKRAPVFFRYFNRYFW